MTAVLKTKKRTEVYRAIRSAALEEFATSGLNGASTQAIAKRAGLSKSQLYYYIDSKEELYKEILLSIMSTWEKQFFDLIENDDPKLVISRYIDRKIRHALENPLECRFFSQEVSRGAPVMRQYWGGAKEAVIRANEIINGWIESGKIKPIDPMLFQMELWAVTQHYADYEAQVRFLLGLEATDPLDGARLIKHAQALFLPSVGIDD